MVKRVMADSAPSEQPTAGITSHETPPSAAGDAEQSSMETSAPMTAAQAGQILAELKTIKQYLLWVLLLGGFFAARAFFFHY